MSLVERQVEVLRERNQSLERKLKELVDVARANDALAERIHRLTQRLIRARDLAATVGAVETSCARISTRAFGAGAVPRGGARAGAAEARFLRADPADGAEVKTFESLLQSGKPRCGQIRDAQRDFLFGKDSVEIGSVALTPLGPKGRLGILAIGASDAGPVPPGDEHGVPVAHRRSGGPRADALTGRASVVHAPLWAWIDRFAAHLSLERRMSRHTALAYRHDLAALARFCERRQFTAWSAVDGICVRAFAAAEHAGGLRPRSIQRRLSAVRSFYDFLLREGGVRAQPRARGARAAHAEAPADHARCGSSGAAAGVPGR